MLPDALAAPFAAIDPAELRRTCAAFATGVTVITTRCDGADHGMTANAFMSVSLSPPLIVVSVNRRARILAKIESSTRYCVSVLAEHMEPVAMHFAGKPRLDPKDIFEDFSGLPAIRGAVAHFATSLHQTIEAGDHVLFVGAIDKIAHYAGQPLIFHNGGFRVIAGGGASTAPAHSWPTGTPREPAGYFEEAPELW